MDRNRGRSVMAQGTSRRLHFYRNERENCLRQAQTEELLKGIWIKEHKNYGVRALSMINICAIVWKMCSSGQQSIFGGRSNAANILRMLVIKHVKYAYRCAWRKTKPAKIHLSLVRKSLDVPSTENADTFNNCFVLFWDTQVPNLAQF